MARMFEKFRLTGDAVLTATPEDAEEKTRAFEAEWLSMKQLHRGLDWAPARLEAHDMRESMWNMDDRYRRRFSALTLCIALEAAAIVALAIVILH